jgi:hypothetical protein
MKTYQLIDGEWGNYKATQTKRVKGQKPEAAEREVIKANKTESKKLDKVLDKYLPEEEVTIIDASVTITDTGERGIINYRGEKGGHQQLRF